MKENTLMKAETIQLLKVWQGIQTVELFKETWKRIHIVAMLDTDHLTLAKLKGCDRNNDLKVIILQI